MATARWTPRCKAIESNVKSGAEMVLYSVNAISGSTESQARSQCGCKTAAGWSTASGQTRISWWRRPKAYLSALYFLIAKLTGWPLRARCYYLHM